MDLYVHSAFDPHHMAANLRRPRCSSRTRYLPCMHPDSNKCPCCVISRDSSVMVDSRGVPYNSRDSRSIDFHVANLKGGVLGWILWIGMTCRHIDAKS